VLFNCTAPGAISELFTAPGPILAVVMVPLAIADVPIYVTKLLADVGPSIMPDTLFVVMVTGNVPGLLG
jgi:hypothetical protein